MTEPTETQMTRDCETAYYKGDIKKYGRVGGWGWLKDCIRVGNLCNCK